MANFLLLLSYLGWGLLWLRAVLILASVAFIVWGYLVLDAALDTILWNALLLVINVVLSVPLILAYVPVRMSKYQKEIYGKYFSSFFTKKQFKRLTKYTENERFLVKGVIEP